MANFSDSNCTVDNFGEIGLIFALIARCCLGSETLKMCFVVNSTNHPSFTLLGNLTVNRIAKVVFFRMRRGLNLGSAIPQRYLRCWTTFGFCSVFSSF